jgi:hypothetical protein
MSSFEYSNVFKVPLNLIAGVLLLARKLFPQWDAWPKTAAEIVELVGASKSQSYALLGRLWSLLPKLVGRQESPPSAPSNIDVLGPIHEYLLHHAGAAHVGKERRHYENGYRRCVLSLRDPGAPAAEMAIADFALAAHIPLGTLKEWLRADEKSSTKVESDPEDKSETLDCIKDTYLRLIATLWLSWKGTFLAFCQMLKTEQRLPYGATFIGNFLQAMGLRKRRRQTPVEASWSGGTYRTLFPGFQWLGDGCSLAIQWGREKFVFNLETFHDTAADATVGFDISRSESEKTIELAYSEGIETTGSPPLCLTLDNKNCNHSPGAREVLPGTILLRATPGRGQAKAMLEGSFGLFSQTMPPLVIEGETQEEMAKNAMTLILLAWYRGRNGRPRTRLGGRTPTQAYQGANPTPEEIKEALAWIRELLQRQERARMTREARLDPVRIQLLKQGLADLEIPDPDQSLTLALAGYCREAIAYGLAVFNSKKELGTLHAVDDHGRYLGGIIRQRHIQLELQHTSDHLLIQRIRLGDLTLEPLQRAAEELRTQVSVSALPKTLVDRALEADSEVEFRLWMREAGNALSELPKDQRETLYKPLTRRIAASYKTDRQRRTELIDRMAQVVTLGPLGRAP